MRTVPIRDSNFAGQACLHASGDNEGRRPASFEWEFTYAFANAWQESPVHPAGEGRCLWLTDSCLRESEGWRQAGWRAIAWLLEPWELHPEPYEVAFEHRDDFEAILTHDRQFIDSLRRVGYDWGRIYYSGGTRIHPSDWGIPEKTRAVSIVASPKRSMEGHRLRHELIAEVGPTIKSVGANPRGFDAYGPEYCPIERKRDALLPYRFHVAIENCRRDYWFTEALIDCFLTGTVPIYWGCPSIGDFFNTEGMLLAETVDHLAAFVWLANETRGDFYEEMLPAIRDNFIRAHEYTMTEDWLFRRYPELFE